MKKIAFFIFLGFLLLPVSVFADSSCLDADFTGGCSISPLISDGGSVLSPLYIHIDWTSYQQVGWTCATDTAPFWGIKTNDLTQPINNFYISNLISWTQNSADFIFSLPNGHYEQLIVVCFDTEYNEIDGTNIEQYEFNIISGGGKLFTMPSDFATGILAMASETINGTKSALFLLVGLLIGSFVVAFIVELFEERQKK